MNLFMLFASSILGLANILETSSFAQCTEELFFFTLIFGVGFRHTLHKGWICKSKKVVRQCIFNASLVTISSSFGDFDSIVHWDMFWFHLIIQYISRLLFAIYSSLPYLHPLIVTIP